jgi:phage tail-like protein
MSAVEPEFLQTWKFRVQIEGAPNAELLFNKADGFESEFAVVETSVGGKITTYKSPGKRKFADVTLSQGLTKSSFTWDWHNLAGDASSGDSVPADLKRTVTIFIYSPGGDITRTITLRKAWISKYVGGTLDAEEEGATIVEEIVITHEEMEIVTA